MDYLSRLASHRVASDTPLVRSGCDQAVIRAAVVREGRRATLEVEINPGRANRARVNKSPLPRTRELAGLVRTVLFAPDDLALVKGDPSERRRFLDDLLVLRTPRLAGVRADYDRVLKQRNSLLKSMRGTRRDRDGQAGSTLEVWDSHLVELGSEVLHERLRLVQALRPYLIAAYLAVARGAAREEADLNYRSAVLPEPEVPAEPVWLVEAPETAPPLRRALLAQALSEQLARRQREELERGITLVGPHRDDVVFTLGLGEHRLPVKGYASHGESWSFALALKLASYELLRADGDDPILILDDVFAELDAERRDQLAALVAGAEQVLVTAAVAADVPEALAGVRFQVADGKVSRVD